jgi:hypothetical protein
MLRSQHKVSDAKGFSSKIIKGKHVTYVRILRMSCIIWILGLLGHERRVQERLSAVLRIDVLAGNATMLLFRGAGLVNATDVDVRKRCHVGEWTKRQQGRGLQAVGP